MDIPLKIENLTKNYGKFEALKGVSFEIKSNEVFALIGPNGAGKSTALKIIATILSSTSGKVEVWGFDQAKKPDEVRRRISYLPEEAGAYKNLTGKQYLEFMAALFTDDANLQREYVQTGSEMAGLGEKLRNKIKTYSKGMTRKLLLARTLMTHPMLAILDEPTSGLDIINALEIRKIIRGLSARGMAVLLSSHNMLEIEFLSDRVAIINQGRIYETGTAQELKQKYSASNLEEVFVRAIK
jgi:ABC-2 type transport system ATP-binding protein